MTLAENVKVLLKQVLGSEWERCAPEVEVWPAPHVPRPLPEGKQAIFGFLDQQGRVLFIGHAGPKSGPRFQSQHYHPNSSPSNLAKTLRQHAGALGLGDIPLGQEGEWIKRHLARFNVYLAAGCPKEKVWELKHRLILELKPILQTRGLLSPGEEGEAGGVGPVAHEVRLAPGGDSGEQVLAFPLRGYLREVRVRQEGGLALVEIRVAPGGGEIAQGEGGS